MTVMRPPDAYPPAAPPASRGRTWWASLLDQLVLLGYVLASLGTAMLLGDALPTAGVVALVAGGPVVALVLVFWQSWGLVRGRRTIGMWLGGVGPKTGEPVDGEEALVWFVSFWSNTAHLLLSPLFGDWERETGIVRDLRGGPAAALGRAAVAVLLVLSPAPLLLALLG